MAMNKNIAKKVSKHLAVKKFEENLAKVISMDNFIIDSSGQVEKLDVSFNNMDFQAQEMYIKNARKVVASKWNSKTFEEEFKDNTDDNKQGFELLYNLYEGDISHEDFVEVLAEHFMRDKILLVNIMKVEVLYDEEDFNYNTIQQYFITVNELKDPKPDLLYNLDGEIELQKTTALEVKLTTPVFGIMYPSIEVPTIDVNSVCFYLKSTKDDSLIATAEEILNIDVLIAEDDKENFFEMLKELIGEKIKTQEIGKIYQELLNYIEYNNDYLEDGELLLGRLEVEKILKKAGFDVELDVDTFLKYAGEKEGFDADEIIKERFVKINAGEHSSISIDPFNIDNIKQEEIDGKKYVMIKLDENLESEGFVLD